MPDYSQKLEDLLDHHLIANEELTKKKKLGGIGYVLNGNMCLGIYEDDLVARVGPSLANSLKDRAGIKPYLPENDDFSDFILIAEGIYKHAEALQKFIEQSLEYTAQLPPKNQNK